MKRTGLHSNKLLVLSVHPLPAPNVRTQKGCRWNLVKSRLTQSPSLQGLHLLKLQFPLCAGRHSRLMLPSGCWAHWNSGHRGLRLLMRLKSLSGFRQNVTLLLSHSNRLKETRKGSQKMKTQALGGARDLEPLWPGHTESRSGRWARRLRQWLRTAGPWGAMPARPWCEQVRLA